MRYDPKKIVTAAMLAAMICLSTLLLRLPSPLSGYVHLGDGAALLAGWLLPPPYGALAAALGATTADLLAGYAVYAPVTCLIKAAMALVAWYGYLLLRKRMRAGIARMLSALAAQLLMVSGYFVFEAILYGASLAALNVLPNILQAAAGIAVGTSVIHLLKKKDPHHRESE